MKSALQEYMDEFVVAKDYNVNNPISQTSFFQEGGFARFIPVGLSQTTYNPIPQIGTPQAPKMDQHELWNSVANNGMQLGRSFMANREMKMRKEEFGWRKEQALIDNQYKQQELEFRKTQFQEQVRQFGINSTMDQVRLMSTISDEFLNQEILAGDVEDYGTLLDTHHIPDLVKNANTPEGLMELSKGLANLTADKDYRRIVGNVMNRDNAMEIYKAIPDAMQPYILNNGEIIDAFMSGKTVPPPVLDQVGFAADMKATRDVNVKYKEAQIKNLEAQAAENTYDAMYKGIMADELKLANEVLKNNLEGKTPDQQLEIYRQFKTKYGSSAGTTLEDPSNVWEAIAYFERQGMSSEKAIAEALRIQRTANANSVSYFGGGGGPDGPADPNAGVSKIGGAMLKNNPNIGRSVTLDSGWAQEVNSALAITPGHQYHSPSGGAGVDITPDVDTFIPGSYKFNGQENDTQYDGTVTVTGRLRTPDYEKAKAIDPNIKQHDSDSEAKYYEVTVITTVPANIFTGADIKGKTPAGSTAAAAGPQTTSEAGTMTVEGKKYSYSRDSSNNYTIKDETGKVVEVLTPDEWNNFINQSQGRAAPSSFPGFGKQ